MAAPIPLRLDYDGPGLRALARRSRDADQTRRLLALASIYDGGSRRSAARLGGVGLQIVRDSCSFRMPMICSSVNLLRFISPSSRWAGLYFKLEEISQGRSSANSLVRSSSSCQSRSVGSELDQSLIPLARA